MPVDEISLGDYVLAGGEVAVLVIVEAVARLLPGVLGNADSLDEESHARRAARGAGLHQAGRAGAGCDVPEVLRSGDHGRIARWRRDEALRGPPPAGPTCWPRSTRRPGQTGPGGRWTGADFRLPAGAVAK